MDSADQTPVKLDKLERDADVEFNAVVLLLGKLH